VFKAALLILLSKVKTALCGYSYASCLFMSIITRLLEKKCVLILSMISLRLTAGSVVNSTQIWSGSPPKEQTVKF